MTKATVLAKGTEMIISGFISKADNNLVDFGWKKIKDANNERKLHEQNIETRIYQVVVDAINAFTFNKYKEQDTLYIAAENIFRGLKEEKKYIEAVKVGLKILEPQISDDRCADFLGILCDEICKDKNDILYKEIDLFQNEQTLREIRKGFGENTRNQGTALEILDDVREDTKYIRETLDNNKVNKAEHHSEIHVQNRAEKYAEKWDKNVFLNDFKKRDKNAGVNIKLRDLYLDKHLPHYIWTTGDEPLSDLKELLREYTVDNNGKNMLLILGQAGIGKSTLITWMMANFIEKKDDFLVYQFASDLKCVNWQNDDILDNIFNVIGYTYRELEGKTLILDGFDEIHVNSDRERILHKLNQELEKKNYLKKISLIITCRENYVDKKELIGVEYITLRAWNEKQIRSFCETYEKENTRNRLEAINNKNLEARINKILENREVFGIPLILYMVLSLNIDIEKNSSMVDIYDQIFSLKRGGIYDRCYDREHRINSPEIKKHIHQISQRIAFWMFENNAEKASIPQEKFKEICNAAMNEVEKRNEDIQRDVLIGNYFASIKHCEGVETDELQFVHRSIYEYFVVVYFFESLHNLTSIEELAGELGELLKKGHLFGQVLEFIKYKFDKIIQYSLFDITKETFQLMLRDGMTYYMKGKYKNIIKREMNIFTNMLEVVHLWNTQLGKFDDNIVCYLRYNRVCKLNLESMDFSGVSLKGVRLCMANLRRSNLSKADLTHADLSGADLNRANLSGADLSGADLNGAHLDMVNLNGANLSRAHLGVARFCIPNLSGANLSKTIFYESQIDMLHEKYDLSQSRVFIIKTDEIISYRDFCTRKQNR